MRIQKSWVIIPGIISILSLASCGQQPLNSEFENDAQIMDVEAATSFYCPKDWKYDAQIKACIQGSRVLGPFPNGMQSDCKNTYPDANCSGPTWEYTWFVKLRGQGECPKGSQRDSHLGACSDGVNVFGPFTVKQAENCKSLGGGSACDLNRWAKEMLKGGGSGGGGGGSPSPVPPPASGTNRILLDYYSQQANYEKVKKDVLGWFGTTKDGCVAFMSTALRHIGVPVPKNKVYDGMNVSLNTAAFTRYLTEERGWKKITKHTELLPGDIVFTTPIPRWPGIPAHTYMFVRWSGNGKSVAWVVDNQAFTHERDVNNHGSANFSPFWYALRSGK